MNATQLASEFQLAVDIAFVDALLADGLICAHARTQILQQLAASSTAPLGALIWRVRLDKNRV